MKIILFLILFATNLAHAEQFKWLDKDSEALQARADIIQQAQTEILAEYFYVGGETTSLAGLALLREAAQRGVKVKIIIDALFHKVPADIMAALTLNSRDSKGNQNIEIKLFNSLNPVFPFSWTHRDHTKLLIADGKVMIIGGRNIACEYFEACTDEENTSIGAHFQDLDAIVTGPSVTAAREQNFYALWDNKKAVRAVELNDLSEKSIYRNCYATDNIDGCEKLRAYSYQKIITASKKLDSLMVTYHSGAWATKPNTQTNWTAQMDTLEESQFLFNTPKFDAADINNFTFLPRTHLISQDLFKIVSTKTKKTLTILTPYLYPSRSTRGMFENLIANGVKIKIITNSLKSTDNYIVQAGYRSIKNQLITMGIELYEYQGPKTAHAKTMVIDNDFIWVGSYNLDPRSENINREIGIAGRNAKLGAELTQIIESFQANSLLVGKDGQVLNQDKADEGVSKLKLWMLFNAQMLLPVLEREI